MINSVITQPLHMSSLHKCGRAGLNFLDLIKELKAFHKSGLFGTRQVAELKSCLHKLNQVFFTKEYLIS